MTARSSKLPANWASLPSSLSDCLKPERHFIT